MDKHLFLRAEADTDYQEVSRAARIENVATIKDSSTRTAEARDARF